MFSRIPASVADTAVVNPNAIKTFLTNGVSTFLVKDKPFLVMIQEEQPKIFLIALF